MLSLFFVPSWRAGYAMRAIRTKEFLYIRNLKPDRQPAGAPEIFNNIDGCASASKRYMLDYRDSPDAGELSNVSFGRQPAEELHDLQEDPEQLASVAEQQMYTESQNRLAEILMKELILTKDPRVLDGGHDFDSYPYRGGAC